MAEQPLSDVKVLDLTRYIAGPYCTKYLADYGADVIKVERPGSGDPARHLGPFLKDDPHPDKSGLFLALNTNKRGITLNLKSDTGKKIFRELVRDVDILVESFSPHVMSSLGLDYESLEKINPKLIMTSISNFGQTGPYRDFKASELILYGMGGAMNEMGLPEREPVKLGGTVKQFQAGVMAMVATMTALWVARAGGTGQHVDVALMETQLTTVDRRGSCLIGHQFTGEVSIRRDPHQITGRYPNGVYPSKDGYIEIIGGVHYWTRVARLIGKPEWATTGRFAGAKGQMDTEAQQWFETNIWYPFVLERTRLEFIQQAQAAGCLCGPLNTMKDVVEEPQWRSRDYWTEIEHPVAGKLTYPGAPVNMPEQAWQAKRPAPLLGQHNEEVYGGLGYSKDDLVKLRERGVI
jgi:crotonobetainyl-CoA:carnitine CoA-transferase CaiB-like acyl-CoA transferase